MAIKPAINQFNGGELSPYLEGRTDWDKYNYSAKLCKNFIPLVEGSLKRRGGSHFVAKVKAKESYTVEFLIKVKTNVVPVLIVDGENLAIDVTFGEDGYNVHKASKTYTDGQTGTITITAEGYRDATDTFTVPSAPREYILKEKSAVVTTATLTIVKATEDIQLKLNGQEVNSYTTDTEEPIVWTALYNGNNASGSVYIEKDSTMVLNVIDGIPELAYENKTLISTDNPGTGEVILAAGKYRVTIVGPGGCAPILGPGYTPPGRSGGAGGCIDADFNLPTGTYEWHCGATSEPDAILIYGTKPYIAGEDSYFKLGNSVIAKGEAAKFNSGGGFFYDKNIVAHVYTEKTGVKGPEIAQGAALSPIGEYGKGAELLKVEVNGSTVTYTWYDATPGFIAITYIGV
jgi:hypothetical protein